MNQPLPAIYKPTGTLLIDDDQLFINNIRSLLPNNRDTHIVSPQDLASIYDSQLFSLNAGRKFDPLSPSKILFKEMPASIPISVIVIDHCMVPDNGLEILRRIKSPFVQKILISNFFTSEQAIDAFNQKLINCFLCKMDPQFVKKLATAIEEAKRKFFYHLSSTIADFFSEENPLTEPKAEELFNKIQNEYDVPYYQASADLKQFEFFNTKDTNRIVMSIFSEDEISELLTSYHAESAPSEILSLVKSGLVLPCGDKDSFPEGKDWRHHLKSANSFQGKKKYFYTIHKAEDDTNQQTK